MTRVRRHLHDERGIDPSSTEVIAYWRQGSSRADLERGSGEDDDGSEHRNDGPSGPPVASPPMAATTTPPPGRGLLEGKVVLVTAAAGTGIGHATAQRCLEEGATVVISDAHERRLADAADGLSELAGGSAPPRSRATSPTRPRCRR